jgi:DNA-nicking Smr family endonuclease
LVDTSENSRLHLKGKKNQSPKCNKHGLPFIGPKVDLFQVFKSTTPEEQGDATAHCRSFPPAPENVQKIFPEKLGLKPRKAFAALVERILAGKNMLSLILEKEVELDHLNKLKMSQRLKCYPSPQWQLDLHGFTAVEAAQKTEDYVKCAFRRGILTLRIIVGKGLHSEGRAVLPDVVEDSLRYLEKEDIVLAYRWENKIKARSGAVIVYLVV